MISALVGACISGGYLTSDRLIALTAGQIDQGQRIVTVDSKLVEVRGHLCGQSWPGVVEITLPASAP
jgi:hypothetical protein